MSFFFSASSTNETKFSSNIIQVSFFSVILLQTTLIFQSMIFFNFFGWTDRFRTYRRSDRFSCFICNLNRMRLKFICQHVALIFPLLEMESSLMFRCNIVWESPLSISACPWLKVRFIIMTLESSRYFFPTSDFVKKKWSRRSISWSFFVSLYHC